MLLIFLHDVALVANTDKVNAVNPELRDKSDSARYWRLREIYMHHRRFFREGYGDDEFFMLSAFQDRISGRPNEYLIGGTGLPTLIKWLEVQADGNNCYVLSGRRKMQFIRSLLEYDEDHCWNES